jgi:hypothetical protein
VIQLLLEMVKPWIWPLTVTLSPVAVVKTIGAAGVPEFATVTFSG